MGTTLRAVGAFLVSAKYTPGPGTGNSLPLQSAKSAQSASMGGGQVTADIESTAGVDCVVHSAAAGGVPPKVVDASTGSAVPLSRSIKRPTEFTFGTEAGHVYRLTMQLI